MDHTRRRALTIGGLGVLGYVGLSLRGPRTSMASEAAHAAFPVKHTADEWRKMLTPQQYDVLRESGTERPYSSPLNNEHREGVFDCAGCKKDLFSSKTKFESGTGWPSFWQPLDAAIVTETDSTFGMKRTAVACASCGGHLGHVFDDGPKPTGLRYCMNGVAMYFKPVKA